uniref:Vacuolar protein sorting-associated protein 18 homolog n=1 Tax=Anopheles triannulatus TaxID=58253 RepID=A0A2M4ADN3_9DIPT
MTSIFDQYSSALIREMSVDEDANAGPKTSGYVSVRTRKDVPIFSKQKMNLNLPSNIMHMAVQNNWLIILMTNLTILRMNLTQPDKFTEVPIDKFIGGLRPSSIYVDPLGAHTLLTFLPKSTGFSPELMYLQRSSFKPKFVSKLKDQDITAVAFNHLNTSETNTGPILLGTAHGVIWEAEIGIESGDKLAQYNIKQAFDVGNAITGLEFFVKADSRTVNCIILVLTVDQLYKFHSSQSGVTATQEYRTAGFLQNVFNCLLKKEPVGATGTHQLPKLAFNYERDSPKSFSFLTEDAVSHQEIEPSMSQQHFRVQMEQIPNQKGHEMPPPASSHKVTPKRICPISFVLTDFHVMLLYADHVAAVSLLDHQAVYEEYFVEQYGRLINIVKDIRSNVIFVYSNKMIFRYKIVDESRNAWKLYADRQKFDLALQYCNKNPAHRDIVLVKQAQSYFYAGNYFEAARIFSETTLGFEEVCLKFMQVDGNEALLLYLRNRLSQLKPQEKTQITMLIVWIVQLYLVQISHVSAVSAELATELQQEFDAFMGNKTVMQCVRKNRNSIYDLMSSYGDTHNLTILTTINQEYESVIKQYINQNRYEEALHVLSAQAKSEQTYKFAPILMEVLPKQTVDMLIAHGHRLMDPMKLMSTLLQLDSKEHAQHAVRFLEYRIHSLGCTERAIHNFLIQLYVTYYADQLLTFLESQGKEITLVNYDPHYALRLTLKHGIIQASVFLQCLLEMWIPAVQLALTLEGTAGRQLARQTAGQPFDRDVRKRMWLIIAEHEIKRLGDADVQQALTILNECDLLRIEDLLPYFSDFQKIDHFKEAICNSLKEYNRKIQEQRKDMEESSKSAAKVRSELQKFRNRSVTLGVSDQCDICYAVLLVRPCLVFHCGHKFHADCLERRVMPLLTPEQAKRLKMLKQTLASTQNTTDNTVSAVGSAPPTISHKEKLKSEIENIMLSQCLYCGELMISNLDQPFVQNWQQADNEWD